VPPPAARHANDISLRHSSRRRIATINSIGNLGGFVDPFVIGWIKEVMGSFVSGLYVVA
jgi:hypothetical protein